MNRPAVELRHISHRYGSFLALDDVSLSVRAGQVYGLLGPNGAGKTTLLRILSTLLRPTSGSAWVLGLDVQAEPEAVRHRIGVLTAGSGLYDRLTPRETLRYFLRLHGLSRRDAEDRAAAALARFGLESFADRPCASLSTGQRQRVLLARALAHDPEVLILDEPTSGLDVVAARGIHALVAEARACGRAVLLSSHDMLEVELLCDTVGILDGGRLRAEGSVAELRQRSGRDKLAEVFLHYLETTA
ncbi:MAG: ABC transporter ATP-binding protein [Myxococcales bacterium]|nr:ABC transporter ATP-binding protein [Myxococcota bacterium]MDW8283077.1 ABC transporter ATP-binding protein [Myxococcales bacterium]